MSAPHGSAFQDDVGQSFFPGVGQREGDIPGAELFGACRRLAVKLDGRALAFWAYHLYVAPAHAVVPSGAEGLHPRFFRGEASGIALELTGLRFAVLDFPVGKDSIQEAFAKALDGFADAGNFGDVDAGAEDHRSIVNW